MAWASDSPRQRTPITSVTAFCSFNVDRPLAPSLVLGRVGKSIFQCKSPPRTKLASQQTTTRLLDMCETIISPRSRAFTTAGSGSVFFATPLSMHTSAIFSAGAESHQESVLSWNRNPEAASVVSSTKKILELSSVC